MIFIFQYIELLKEIYEKVEDVELAVAGLLETKVNGTLAGPTFLCILLEQFHRTRVGDRFFYENGKGFTPSKYNYITISILSGCFVLQNLLPYDESYLATGLQQPITASDCTIYVCRRPVAKFVIWGGNLILHIILASPSRK